MYADSVTDAMREAIDETQRRREVQLTYNEAHGIEPKTIIKEIRDLTDRVRIAAQAESALDVSPAEMEPAALDKMIRELEKEMRTAAENWEFEKAAALRDQIFDLRRRSGKQGASVEARSQVVARTHHCQAGWLGYS